jgi:hypothetical protein
MSFAITVSGGENENGVCILEENIQLDKEEEKNECLSAIRFVRVHHGVS